MHYQKKPIQSQVEFAQAPGILQTLEGPVSFAPGDALMTGTAGERWPIRRQHFETTYVPVPPTRMGENGHYMKIPMKVTARQARTEELVPVKDGQQELFAKTGDWIITAVDGHRWVVANDIFRRTYEYLDESK